jgi:sulfur carrier protein ThiS
MKLIINGQSRESQARTLADLLKAEGLAQALQDCVPPITPPRGPSHDDPAARPARPRIALARNGALVRRADWLSVRLAEGDVIEIVKAVGGG